MSRSERVGRTGVEGTLLTEAKYINLSLHFLEQVMMSLSVTVMLHDITGIVTAGNCGSVREVSFPYSIPQLHDDLCTP